MPRAAGVVKWEGKAGRLGRLSQAPLGAGASPAPYMSYAVNLSMAISPRDDPKTVSTQERTSHGVTAARGNSSPYWR
jgi:hypothetical protein